MPISISKQDALMTPHASGWSHLGPQGLAHMINNWRSHGQEARRHMKVAILGNKYNLRKQYWDMPTVKGEVPVQISNKTELINQK